MCCDPGEDRELWEANQLPHHGLPVETLVGYPNLVDFNFLVDCKGQQLIHKTSGEVVPSRPRVKPKERGSKQWQIQLRDSMQLARRKGAWYWVTMPDTQVLQAGETRDVELGTQHSLPQGMFCIISDITGQQFQGIQMHTQIAFPTEHANQL